MTSEGEGAQIVSASREIAAEPAEIFELIADPVQQPRWDGNDNLAEAPDGQRIRGTGEVFVMTTTSGSVRENHVVEFEEGRRVAWTPADPAGHRPDTCGGGSWTRSTGHERASRTRTTGAG